ncbi:MAG: tyrosine-type recombinase/integrase [Robiginitomaculum sp.]|nr:tyrosine-type recombinase/integrase [Robiginitomaculum sp.]
MSVLRTSNISKKDIVKLRKDLLSAEVSRYTAKMAFELLKNMFRWANDDDLIHVDPAAGLTIASTSKKLQVLHNQEDDDFSVVGDVNLTHTPTQMQTIYDLADKWATTKGNRQKGWINLRTLFRMYLFTGMRSSEILGLPVRHVDLNNRRIRIRQKLDRYGNVGPVKSVFGIREVPILPELLELLTIHIEGKDKDDFVFSTEGGNPLGYRNILRSMWYNLQEGAGLKKKGVHALRHFYGSALVVSGTAREHLVQKLMGHHSPEFTKNIYAHLFCDEYDLALDSLARVERGEFQVSVSLMQDFKNIEKII